MKTFNREELLDALSWSTDWTDVRDWIRDMVVIEPKVMKKVSEAKFGDLGSWIEQGRGNVSVCGCLVGTTAIELTKDRNHFKANRETEQFVCTAPIADWVPLKVAEAAEDQGDYGLNAYADAHEVVDALVVYRDTMSERAYEAGFGAAGMKEQIGQDAAVWLIKSEIQRQLGFQRQRIRAAKKAAKSVRRDKKTGQFKRAA